MNAKTVFRLLLVAILLGAIASALIASFPGNITEDWRTITEWNGNGGFYERLDSVTSPAHIAGRVAVISLLAVIVLFLLTVYVGLFLFWRFARLSNLLLTILLLLLAPWSGLVILLPIEAAVYDFTVLCEGAVIALSYTSPVKDYFERKQVA